MFKTNKATMSPAPLAARRMLPSQTWQAAESGRTFNNWSAAVNLAHVLKSPRGQARVIDATGRVVYLI